MTTILPAEIADSTNDALYHSNLDDLTPETLLAAFETEGIRSLEDLSKQMAEALRDPRGRPEQWMDYSVLFAEPTPAEVLETITHPRPSVPFVVNGVVHDPEDITRYNGRELGFIPQNDNTELLVLADKRTWGPFVRTLLLSRAALNGGIAADHYQYGGYSWSSPQDGPVVIIPPAQRPGPPGSPVPPPAPPELSLWTDVNLQGSALTLYSGQSYRDLRDVGWWIFAGDWNDQFSSAHKTSSLCMAFEHINFSGSFLWLGPSEQHFLDLHAMSWGDRISSVINSG